MKKFVPLFEQFQHDEAISVIIKQLADAIEDSGRFSFVQVRPGNVIYVEYSYNMDDDTYYVHDDSVRVYSTYRAALKPVITEDEVTIKLLDAGLSRLQDVIVAFEWATEFELDSKDCSLDYTSGDIDAFSPEDTVDWADFGLANETDIETIGSDLAQWLFDSWDEYAFRLDVQAILDKQFPERDYIEDDDEDEDDDINESDSHDEPFIQWACEQLGIETCPKIEFGDDHGFAIQNKSMAYFHPGEYRIYVLRGSRTKADWLRSLAHELVHAHQFERGEDLDGSTGSPHENEANSKAGQLLRAYGKIDSTIYEG
jgi:hypothetical protein